MQSHIVSLLDPDGEMVSKNALPAQCSASSLNEAEKILILQHVCESDSLITTAVCVSPDQSTESGRNLSQCYWR